MKHPDLGSRNSASTIMWWAFAVVLLALAGLTAWLYSPDKPRELLAAKYVGDYRNADRVRLRLRDTGPRDAPAIVMLHGFGSSLDTWEPWAKVLSARYRVIRFDLPGFGLTGPDPTGDYSDERSVRILVTLLDQLGVKRAHIIGNSLGSGLTDHSQKSTVAASASAER